MKTDNPIQAAWFTWEIQPRNRSMSKALDIPLFEIISKRGKIMKYPELIRKTLNIIRNRQIEVLFVQNPSIVLSALAIACKMFLGKTVFVDAHNSGIYPAEGKSRILGAIARWIIRHADSVIVSNQYLADIVHAWGGNPLVIPDPLPDLHTAEIYQADRPYVLFVCTWAADEPYWEVIEAAKQLPAMDIYITGKYQKVIHNTQISAIPANVKLLGYVSENDYLSYFSGALCAIDLTTRDHCLVCGAYEAARLGIPAVLSDIRVNREVFNQGFIYTANTAHAIAAAVENAIRKRGDLTTAINEFARHHEQEILTKTRSLKNRIRDTSATNAE